MTDTDTSAEAVERAVKKLTRLGQIGRESAANSLPITGVTNRDGLNIAATLLALLAERAEAVAALALYRAENGCTRGQRTTQWCGEATKLRRAWLRVIQAENQCPASGGGCLSKRCGCLAEMEMLIGETRHD